MMAVNWKLREWLAVEYSIFRAVDLQRLIKDKTGVRFSNQAITKLVNKTPKQLKIETIQLICNVLDCKLSDFCEITPEKPGEEQ